MSVPNTFNLATGAIPLSQLDANFAYYDAAFQITGTAINLVGAVTFSAGTANGVAYLNGSKVLTTGSALTFDGANLGVNTTPLGGGRISTIGDFSAVNGVVIQDSATTYANNDWYLLLRNSSNNAIAGLSHPAANSLGVWGNDDIRFLITGAQTEQMRLTSTGLGIGTSSPHSSAKLHVYAAGDYTDESAPFTIGSAATGDMRLYAGVNNTSDYTYIGSVRSGQAYGSLVLQPNGGNLGLGVTPSAWFSTVKVFQFGQGAALESRSNANLAAISANQYINTSGNYTYLTTDYATRYYQNNGQHIWQTAPSGTAGNAISFTQAMTLDAGGNLIVGGTTAYSTVTMNGSFGECFVANIDSATISASNRVGFRLYELGQLTGGLTYARGDARVLLSAHLTDPLAFETNGTERARIDSSGNLLVGTTSTGAGLGTNSAIVGSYGPVFKSTGGAGFEAGDFWNASTTGDAYFVYWRTEAGGTVRGSVNYNRSLGLTSYNTTSDRRAKDILGPVTNSGETIDAIQVHIGQMHGATQSRPMFIADELQGPAPYCVTGEKNAVNEKGEPVYQQVDHSPLIPLLVAEIQSLRKRLAAAGIA